MPVAGSPGSKNAPDTSSTVVTRMTKVNVRSATYPVSVHEATTGKELGAIELLGRSFRMRVSVVPRHRGESQLENLARAVRSTKRDRNKKRRRPESGDGCRVPLEVAVRMALTWASPDRSVLSLAFASHRKWRFVGRLASGNRGS